MWPACSLENFCCYLHLVVAVDITDLIKKRLSSTCESTETKLWRQGKKNAFYKHATQTKRVLHHFCFRKYHPSFFKNYSTLPCDRFSNFRQCVATKVAFTPNLSRCSIVIFGWTVLRRHSHSIEKTAFKVTSHWLPLKIHFSKISYFSGANIHFRFTSEQQKHSFRNLIGVQ